MKKLALTLLTTLLTITPTISLAETTGSWRDAVELYGETPDLKSACASDTLAKDALFFRNDDRRESYEFDPRSIDIDYLVLAKTKRTVDKAWAEANSFEFNREITALGFEVEQNVFMRKEQIDKFLSLINSRILKMRSAKTFCDDNGRRLNVNYLLETKQLAIGTTPDGFFRNRMTPKHEVKEYEFSNYFRGWSTLIPFALDDGRKWEETRFLRDKKTPTLFTVSTCKKDKNNMACSYDVIRFEYPYIGDDGMQHAYVYNNGKFTRN